MMKKIKMSGIVFAIICLLLIAMFMGCTTTTPTETQPNEASYLYTNIETHQYILNEDESYQCVDCVDECDCYNKLTEMFPYNWSTSLAWGTSQYGIGWKYTMEGSYMFPFDNCSCAATFSDGKLIMANFIPVTPAQELIDPSGEPDCDWDNISKKYKDILLNMSTSGFADIQGPGHSMLNIQEGYCFCTLHYFPQNQIPIELVNENNLTSGVFMMELPHWWGDVYDNT